MLIFSVFGVSSVEAYKSASEHLENEVSISHHDHTDKDCAENDCHEGDDCCHGFCQSCASSVILNNKVVFSYIENPLLSKQHWFFYNNYRSPLLDTASKPPLFS